MSIHGPQATSVQNNSLSVSLFLAFFLVLFCSMILFSQDMSSKECGSCHEGQYQNWLKAKHNERGVVCAACHGSFHSGTLNGCTACHTGEHNIEYQNWGFVKDYMVEGDTSDYYCIVCHDPHHPKKAKVLLCNSCHGSATPEIQPRKAFRASLQKAHNTFADVAPKMDEAAWNRRVKSRAGKILMGAGVVMIGGLIVFPYLYTGYAFLRWLKRKFKKSSGK